MNENEKVLLNVILRLPVEVWTELQDQMEEFNFGQDELISIVVMAAVLGLVESGKRGCLYERIDWIRMRERGLCE